MNNELIALIANLALTLSFIIALIFGIAQVQTANRDRTERLTLETLRTFQSREFAELILHVTTRNMPANINEWNALSFQERVMFVQFAQEMESVGIQVAEGLIDLDLVDITLGSLVVTSWAKYSVVFSDMREKQLDPFLGEYFQWLAEQIDRRMREHPRKPFFETGARRRSRHS
jgi:hypothetical protein